MKPPVTHGVIRRSQPGDVQIFLEQGAPNPAGCSLYFVVGDADGLHDFHKARRVVSLGLGRSSGSNGWMFPFGWRSDSRRSCTISLSSSG